jgi:hypothetical protein
MIKAGYLVTLFFPSLIMGFAEMKRIERRKK